MKENLIKRSITGFFLVAGLVIWMFVGAIYLDNPFKCSSTWASYTFMAFSTIFLIITLYEIINLRKKMHWNLMIKIIIFIMAIVCLWFPFGNEHFAFYHYDGKWFSSWMNVLVYAFFLLILFIFTWTSKGKFTVNDVMFLAVWGFYLILTFKGLNFLMLQKNSTGQKLGWPTMLYFWTIVISSDVGAYFGGMMFGKKPLAPKISPKKTWEGSIIGFLVAVVLSMILVTLLFEVGGYYPLPILVGDSGKVPVYIIYIGISCILAVVSQLGDLLFSYLKRNHEVKDFSNILPGHGGFLDRLDSFSAVIIVGYLIVLLLLIN